MSCLRDYAALQPHGHLEGPSHICLRPWAVEEKQLKLVIVSGQRDSVAMLTSVWVFSRSVMVTWSWWDGDGLCKETSGSAYWGINEARNEGMYRQKYNASAPLSSALLCTINLPKFPCGYAAVQWAWHWKSKQNWKLCYQQDVPFRKEHSLNIFFLFSFLGEFPDPPGACWSGWTGKEALRLN